MSAIRYAISSAFPVSVAKRTVSWVASSADGMTNDAFIRFPIRAEGNFGQISARRAHVTASH